MDTKLLIFLGLVALFEVSHARIKCHVCNRWQVGILNGGDDEDECRDPSKEDTPESEEECTYCLTDTCYEKFDWIERKCVKVGKTCRNGTVVKSFIDILDLSDVTEYKVQRKCCDTDLCNNDPWETGAAVIMRTSYILFAPGLIFAFFRM